MNIIYYEFSSLGGIHKIVVDVANCNVNIAPTSDKKIIIEKTRRRHIKVSQNGEVAKIIQVKGTRFKKAELNISLPENFYELQINVKCGELKIEGSSYKYLELGGDNVSANLTNVSFAAADIYCKKLSFCASNLKSANEFRVRAEDGVAIMNNCTLDNLDMNFENGSFGLVDLK